MSTQGQAILDAALTLPEKERLLLVERLLETLPSEAEEVTDDEFFAELERRSADFDSGRADAVSWSELQHLD
jgi:putative addiction module component (TIGR02574 family)